MKMIAVWCNRFAGPENSTIRSVLTGVSYRVQKGILVSRVYYVRDGRGMTKAL